MKRYIVIAVILYPCLLHTDVIDNFAQALQNISVTSKQEVNEDEVLLGPWLLKNKKNIVLAHDGDVVETKKSKRMKTSSK